MNPSTVETLIWVLIYGGLLLAGLGWFVQDTLPSVALGLWLVGGFDVVAGAALIWLRSRMQAPKDDV